MKVREVAISHNDVRLLAFAARDIVAAEAHYHPSCYRDYTRPEKLGKAQRPKKTQSIKLVKNFTDFLV